jgi:hypothetical protein
MGVVGGCRFHAVSGFPLGAINVFHELVRVGDIRDAGKFQALQQPIPLSAEEPLDSTLSLRRMSRDQRYAALIESPFDPRLGRVIFTQNIL